MFNFNYEEQFEKFLKAITEKLAEEEHQSPLFKRRRLPMDEIAASLNETIFNFELPKTKPESQISTEDFINQIVLALRDEFIADISVDKLNKIHITFSQNDAFMISIAKL